MTPKELNEVHEVAQAAYRVAESLGIDLSYVTLAVKRKDAEPLQVECRQERDEKLMSYREVSA